MSYKCPNCGNIRIFFKKRRVEISQTITGSGTLLNTFETPIIAPVTTEYLECGTCKYKDDIRKFELGNEERLCNTTYICADNYTRGYDY